MKRSWNIGLASALVGAACAGCDGTHAGAADMTTSPDLAHAPIGMVSLDPPAKGFQLATGDMPVASGDEVQGCYFFKVPDLNNGQPFYVDNVEVAQNVGSHHMNIFRQKTIQTGR